MEIKRIIAKKEFEVIGGKPQVFRYWDNDERKKIDILSSLDRPFRGVISYATIGLSECEINLSINDKSLRVELLGACDKNEMFFANVLATVAFEIMTKKKCSYGDIIQNAVAEYSVDTEMKHVYLMNPFLWKGFETLEFSDRSVAWLLIIPISEQEKDYATVNGWKSLEDKFDKFNIDIFDLNRKSII
ncbi:MAG: suppressor of fused domain protein [Lachnospiraceae bacterium]|nr:suppressor of fused domain protein [Lachnospiraceae bacterium]